MKYILVVITALVIVDGAFAQSSKGHWFAGGTVLRYSKTNERTLFDVVDSALRNRYTQVFYLPHVGYFVSDKLGVGLSLLYATERSGFPDAKDHHWYTTRSFGAGPFVRYYFLPKKNKFNLLINGTYQISRQKTKGIVYFNNYPAFIQITRSYKQYFILNGGPSYKITPALNLELSAGYNFKKLENQRQRNRMLLLGLGLQYQFK